MKRTALALFLLLACTVVASACKEYRPKGFREPLTLGGKTVPAAVLTLGEQAYVQYCRACHGDQGDGKGPAAQGMRPPPRDFTEGTFKFGAVQGGELPNDEDLERIIRSGLHGTAMLAWDGIQEHKVQAIIQYIKTFSERWKDEEPGEPIRPTPDPWKGREADAVARGRLVYHGLAQCHSCHPAFASKDFIRRAAKELTGSESTEFREDLHGSMLTDSGFGVKILPPDFTRSELRSIRPDHRLEDLYRVIASGVGGTAMPTWKGSLPEEELWAMAHFVDSLVAARGTEVRRLFQDDSGEEEPPPKRHDE
jgi:mono/diheme cytochrome c family protein